MSRDTTKHLIEELYTYKWGVKVTFHEVLRTLYIEQNHSIRDIADMLYMSVGAVHKYLQDEGITKDIKCKK